MRKTYSELLKDPRWQKTRLRVLEGSGFKCESCEEDKKTLHVHHTYYEKGRCPWEYPIDSLECLCETCHSEATLLNRKLLESINGIGHDGEMCLGYIKAVRAHSNDTILELKDLTGEELLGASDYWRVSGSDAFELIKSGNGTWEKAREWRLQKKAHNG